MLKESLLAWGQEEKDSTSKIWLDKQVVYMRGGLTANKNRVYLLNIDGTESNKYFDIVYTDEYPKGNSEYFYTDKQTQALIRVAMKKDSTYVRTAYFQMFDPNTGAILDQHKVTGYTINVDDFLTFVNVKDGLYTAYFTGTYPGTTGVIQKEKHRVFVYMPKHKKMYEIEIPNGVIAETAAQLVISVSDVSHSCIYEIENVAKEDENPIFHFQLGHYFYDGFMYKTGSFEYNTATNSLWNEVITINYYAGMGTPARAQVNYFDYQPTRGERWDAPIQFSTENPTGNAIIGNDLNIVTINSQRKLIYSTDGGNTWTGPVDSGIVDSTNPTFTCGIKTISPVNAYYFISPTGKIAKSTTGTAANSYSLISPIPQGMSWQSAADRAGDRTVVIGSSGYYAVNTNIENGSGWIVGQSSTLSTKSDWRAVVTLLNRGAGYFSYKFIALNYQGYISFSDDGITWTAPVAGIDSSSVSNWRNLVLTDNGFLVALSANGYTSSSTDGIHWTAPVSHSVIDLSSGSISWMGMVYSSSITSLIVVSGTGGYVAKSPASKDNAGIVWQKYETSNSYTSTYLLTCYYSIRRAYDKYDAQASKRAIPIQDAISRIYLGSNETSLYYEPITISGTWFGNMSIVSPLYRNTSNVLPTVTTVNVYSTSGSTSSLEFYGGPKYYFRYPTTSLYRNFLTSTLMYNNSNHTLNVINHKNALLEVRPYDVRTGNQVSDFYTGSSLVRFPSTDKHFVVGAIGSSVSSSNPYRYVTLVNFDCYNNDTLVTNLSYQKLDCNKNSQMQADYNNNYVADNQFYPLAIGDGDAKTILRATANLGTIEIPKEAVYRLTLIGGGETSRKLSSYNSTSGVYSAYNMNGGSGAAIQIDIKLNPKYLYSYRVGYHGSWSGSTIQTHHNAEDSYFSWIDENGVTHSITAGAGKWGTVNRDSNDAITSISGLQGGSISTSGSLDIEKTIVWNNGNNGVGQYTNTQGAVLSAIGGILAPIDTSLYDSRGYNYGASCSTGSITNTGSGSAYGTGLNGYIQLEFLHY